MENATVVLQTNTTAPKSLITRAIATAREIKELTGCCVTELRDVIPMIMPDLMSDGESDFTVHLGGNEWRFIRESRCEDILASELGCDTYMLGCFNASFLCGIIGMSQRLIEVCQKAEAFDDLGQAIVDGGYVSEIASAYMTSDGPGHHFSSDDGETNELKTIDYYAFNCG